jgi:PAS domain S-box-containing protein
MCTTFRAEGEGMTAFHSLDHGALPEDEPSSSSEGAPSSSDLHSSTPSFPEAQLNRIDASFYQAAVRHAGIPIIPLDVTGRILAWNQAAVQLFGRSQSDVLGRPMEILIRPEFRPDAALAFSRTIQQRSVNMFEMTIVPEGGKHEVHLAVTLSCVIDPAGNLLGATAWMRNITNRKELESHLTRTTHMASVGTLAAGVAHHFNNIACGISTMVEFALATEDPGAMSNALSRAMEGCSRIRYITQSLLDASGDTCNGEGTLEPDLSDLTEEILGFADAVEPTLNHKGTRLFLDLNAGRVTAVPRIRFGQVLQHLLRNSEDAIAERAAVTIGAEKKITIRTQSQGDQIMVEFSDTGCGVEPDDLPQIFHPFFTKKGVCGGGNGNNPGLGLTLVQSVIIGMGGDVWADSIPGGGMMIHMLIPITL